jgi:serine/threonine-protein kinase HipA
MGADPIEQLFGNLPRGAPGSDACTLDALRRLPPIPPHARVLDLGCGSGPHTLVLARTLGVKVQGVDLHQPSLDRLRVAADRAGLADLVEVRCADFSTLEIAPASIDLLWSEGAAYAVGFEESLRRWHAWLAPGGLMAVSECSWLTDSPPDEAKRFWDAAYPAMSSMSVNGRRAERAGLVLLDRFVLPEAAWWDEYYRPLAARVAELRPTAAADLLAILDGIEREIALYERFADAYGYVFYLLQRQGSAS